MRDFSCVVMNTGEGTYFYKDGNREGWSRDLDKAKIYNSKKEAINDTFWYSIMGVKGLEIKEVKVGGI